MRWVVCVVGLMACGPSVESSDGGDASTGDATGTSSSTTSSSSTGTSTTSAGTLTTSADVTTVPPTSSTDESGSSTTGPEPECVEAGFEHAYFGLAEESVFELDADCDVLDIGDGLDSTFMNLDCGADGMRLVVGSGLDIETLLAGHPTVHVLAAGDPAPPEWSHLAVYDLSGSLIFGTHDLSPTAPYLIAWFTPFELEVVVDQCQLERGDDCPEERVAIDFTHQGAMTRIFDRNADELAGYEIVVRASRVHPGASASCPNVATLAGWFTMHRLP